MTNIVLTAEDLAKVKDPDVAWVQKWLNIHGALPALKIDGVGGTLTRNAFINVFIKKSARKITQDELKAIAYELGDANTSRIKAVASVESGPYGGWFASGLPVILYERHKYWQFVKKAANKVKSWFSNPVAGDYTMDANQNGINDSWEKLSFAICKEPLAALKSVSIGKFQIMGMWYQECGYSHPIDMLWAARNSELAHYQMLRDYIVKVANLQAAFLQLNGNPENCRAFAKGYNGSSYAKYSYHIKLAKELR